MHISIQYLNLHQLSSPVAWCWSRWTVYLEATDLLVTSPVIADLPGERQKNVERSDLCSDHVKFNRLLYA